MVILLFTGCVDHEFDEPPQNGEDPALTANATVQDLRDKFTSGKFTRITEDWIVEAIVVADDESGNYYKTLVVQDETGGIDVKINANSLFQTFWAGRKVFIKAKGLVVSDYNELIQLGGSVGFEDGDSTLYSIEEWLIDDHIIPGTWNNDVNPPTLSLNEVDKTYMSQLVRFEDVQFSGTYINGTYADAENLQSRNITIQDCEGSTLLVRTSGYADFAGDTVNSKRGNLLGIVSVYQDDIQIYIRNTDDIQFDQERCIVSSVPGELMSIQELRDHHAGGATNAPANKKIRGVVTSDYRSGTIHGLNVIIQEPDGAGILVRFRSDPSFIPGDLIEVSVSDKELGPYQGLLQVQGIELEESAFLLNGQSIDPQEITVSELNNNFESFESELLLIKGVSFSGGTTFSGSIDISDGSGSTLMYTRSGATFAGENLPTESHDLTCIATQGGSAEDQQVMIRTLADIDGFTPAGGDDIIWKIDFQDETDYEPVDIAGWTNFVEKGTEPWYYASYFDDGYAEMKSYESADSENVCWLVTPAITVEANLYLTFLSSMAYFEHDGLTVYISEDFNGSDVLSATWEILPATLATSSDEYHEWIPSGDIDLSAYSGDVHIAFKYEGSKDSGNTTSFRLDDIVLKNVE
jgi:DNA/RNA endonuclease YhcR with UshA esterase domain